MKDFIAKNKLKIVALAFACTVFFASLIAMQFQVGGFTTKELGNKAIFDSQLTYYSGNYFYDTLALMPADAVVHYRAFHILDYFFVISYYILMYASLRFVLPKKYHALCFIIPALPAVCDFAENISLDVLMANYPAQSSYASALGVWTCLKWYLGVIWLITFSVFLIIKILNYKKAKTSKDSANMPS